MIVQLTKNSRKTVDLVVIELAGTLIHRKEGKVGRPFTFSSTLNPGSVERAVEEVKSLIEKYKEKGFEINNEKLFLIDFEVFDKAKWHLNENFPLELSSYQAYIHTGLYIGWLIKNKLISREFEIQNSGEITRFIQGEISPVRLYHDQMDGVFTSNDVNLEGYNFTKSYFDFENGQYLTDYENALAQNLPSLFNVEDTKNNFQIISALIDNNYKNWKANNL